MAKAAAGTKKTKEAISKAATQKTGGAKVTSILRRNGPREKSKKKPTMQSSSIELPMIRSSQVSPSSASTSRHQPSLKSSKSLAPLPAPCFAKVSRLALSERLRLTADKLFTLRSSSQPLRRPSLLRLRMLPRRRRHPRRNDV